RLWDVGTGKQIHKWDSFLNTKYLKPVFSPGSKLLASSDNNIRVWEVVSGRELIQFPQGLATGLAFSPSGRFLATTELELRTLTPTEDINRIILWELVSGQVVRRIDRKEKTAWS